MTTDGDLLKMFADCEREERQSRLEEFAKVALGGMLANPESFDPQHEMELAVRYAWDLAEAMEAERVRRMEKGE